MAGLSCIQCGRSAHSQIGPRSEHSDDAEEIDSFVSWVLSTGLIENMPLGGAALLWSLSALFPVELDVDEDMSLVDFLAEDRVLAVVVEAEAEAEEDVE